MSNESEVIIDPINEEVEETEKEGEESQNQEHKQDKLVETPEARKARLDRQVEQHRKKHPELYEKTAETIKSKSDEFDYGQKAFLVANDIKGKNEIELVRAIMKDTGKTLEDVLESKYFKAEIKEMRELEKTNSAMDTKSKRGSQSASNSVDYWIAKGELPEDRELRSKVIAERRKQDSKGNPFKR